MRACVQALARRLHHELECILLRIRKPIILGGDGRRPAKTKKRRKKGKERRKGDGRPKAKKSKHDKVA
eukprot:COSAG01_NODE_6478_length_3644_cov_2.427645_3_plen_68_part_00